MHAKLSMRTNVLRMILDICGHEIVENDACLREYDPKLRRDRQMTGRVGEDRSHASLLSAALKAIRKDRRLRPSEVAKAMNMPLRSYEHFEAGRGRLSYERIARFAEVTNSDALAIWMSVPMESPEFALRCVDNKLMTIVAIAVSELSDELTEDLVYLEAGTLIGAFTRVAKDLVTHVRSRDTFAEAWLQEKTRRVRTCSERPVDWRRKVAAARS